MQASSTSSTVFMLLCAGLCYTGFCRLAHVSKQSTDPFVSTAIWAMTVSAVFGIFSVSFWGYEAGWPAVFIAAGMLGLQVATSRAWMGGLPDAYKRRKVP